jgi:hypothetical protein
VRASKNETILRVHFPRQPPLTGGRRTRITEQKHHARGGSGARIGAAGRDSDAHGAARSATKRPRSASIAAPCCRARCTTAQARKRFGRERGINGDFPSERRLRLARRSAASRAAPRAARCAQGRKPRAASGGRAAIRVRPGSLTLPLALFPPLAHSPCGRRRQRVARSGARSSAASAAPQEHRQAAAGHFCARRR